MSEQPERHDAAALWREQPEEAAVKPAELVNRRTQELSASTRSEILMSLAAAALLGAVAAVRFASQWGRAMEIGLAAVAVWIVASLVRFRGRIWRKPPAADAMASSGLEFYRRELERRRDHLRGGWLWYGPLLLACAMLAGVLWHNHFLEAAGLWRAAPLLALLGAWTVFDLRRRHRQAKELQREIDELGR